VLLTFSFRIDLFVKVTACSQRTFIGHAATLTSLSYVRFYPIQANKSIPKEKVNNTTLYSKKFLNKAIVALYSSDEPDGAASFASLLKQFDVACQEQHQCG
jgi:hypothetical protein